MSKNFSVKDRRDIQYLDKGNPYFEYKKYAEPTECSVCGLVFSNGKWSIKTLKTTATSKEICPACRIIRDNIPFGVAKFEGSYLNESTLQELKNIIKNVEKKVKEKRPLQRIIKIEETKDGVTVYTTYDHLARRIGEAVYRSFKGELNIKYQNGERIARVYWRRDL